MFYHNAVTRNMQSGFQRVNIVFDSYDGVSIKGDRINSRVNSQKKIGKLSHSEGYTAFQ